MRYSRRQVLRDGVLAVGALAAMPEILSACGTSAGSPASSTSAGSAPSSISAGSAAWKEVEAAAQKEKTVAVYTFPSDMPVIKMFRADYPWATVNFTALAGNFIPAKVLTEHRAGQNIADAITLLESDLPDYLAAKPPVPAQTTVPNDSLTLKTVRDDRHYLHAVNQVLYPYIYTAPGLNPPKDLFDLADPAWKGKVAFDAPSGGNVAAIVLGSRRQLWGDAKWYQWLQGLKDNNVLLTQSAIQTYTSILQGERPLGFSAISSVLTQPKGAPVRYAFYEDPVSVPTYMMVAQAAPHPNMARLFVNYMLSPKIQRYYASVGRSPCANIDTPFSFSKIIPKGFTSLSENQMTNFDDNLQSYLAIYAQYWPS
jgi:iron(III) transport system substrate-binding protein